MLPAICVRAANAHVCLCQPPRTKNHNENKAKVKSSIPCLSSGIVSPAHQLIRPRKKIKKNCCDPSDRGKVLECSLYRERKRAGKSRKMSSTSVVVVLLALVPLASCIQDLSLPHQRSPPTSEQLDMQTTKPLSHDILVSLPHILYLLKNRAVFLSPTFQKHRNYNSSNVILIFL